MDERFRFSLSSSNRSRVEPLSRAQIRDRFSPVLRATFFNPPNGR